MKIIGSILLVLLFTTDIVAEPFQPTKKITLEDIYKNNLFRQKNVYNIRSMQDGEHYTVLEDYHKIVKCSYSTGKEISTLFSIEPDGEIPYIYEYELNKDESKILICSDVKFLYRHSFYANYYVIDLTTDSITKLSDLGKIRNAVFSPNGKKVAYVFENNIYLKDLKTSHTKQITTDGKMNEIINGVPDWVYEEEFGFSLAYQWSPDSKSIAYYKFDEKRVKYYSIPQYHNTYPEQYTYKYPKAGEENAIVSIYVCDINSGTSTLMDIGEETDQYIPRIKWTKDKLAIIRLNRLQNKVDVLLNDPFTGKHEIIYSEENKYYISEIDDNYLTFTDDGESFVIMSEQDAFRQLYHYSIEGKMINKITPGNYDVKEMIGLDTKTNMVYYSSHEESVLQTNVYRVKIDGTSKERLSPDDGTNSAEFSSGFKYYINKHSSANMPYNISLFNSDKELIRVLEDNSQLVQTMQDYGFSKKELFSFQTTEGIDLNGFMIKPGSFKKSKKYPVLMYVYGGPESQNVKDAYSYNDPFFQFLTQQGYIVVCVDNRGTDGRGEEFRKSTYMNLGKLETSDQIETAIYLGDLPYVDKSRIGIFGWSYGGYMSLLCMTKGSDYFKAGVSVAPVTNWRYYDTIYTERFMRTPQENPDGYDDNSPINYAEKLQGKLLLIHGTADDNVHFQNSVMMIDKLIKAGKQFDLQVYPNKQHGIGGAASQYHLYTRISNFLLEEL